jgi:two-component system NtrC family sensor kinase
VLEDCLVLVDHVISKSEVTISIDRHETPPVHINPGELQQVVINLIINSVQAMQNKGRLEILIRPALHDGRGGAKLVISDTGSGISEEKLNTVFDPFYTTKLGEGTGLGLSVSQTLIQAAGGLITVRNSDIGGAQFTIWLPCET